MQDVETALNSSVSHQTIEGVETKVTTRVPRFLSKLKSRKKAEASVAFLNMESKVELSPIHQYLRDSIAIPEYLRQLTSDSHSHNLADEDIEALTRCEYLPQGNMDGFEVDVAVFRTTSIVVRWNLQDEISARNRKRAVGRKEPSLPSIKEEESFEEDNTAFNEAGSTHANDPYPTSSEDGSPVTGSISRPSGDSDEELLSYISTFGIYEGHTPAKLSQFPSEFLDSATSIGTLSRSSRFCRYPLNTFYDATLLHKIIVQQHLKQVTELDCIPHIIGSRAWLDSSVEIVDGIPQQPHPDSLSWVLEDCQIGTKVQLTRSHSGTDKIHYWDGRRNKWIRLHGRKKERFLDDLARIQVAYTMITSSRIGPLVLQACPDGRGDLFPITQLDDRFNPVTVDVIPDDSSPRYRLWDRIVTIPSNASTFLKHLISVAIEGLTPIPGPYPLQPAGDMWSNININPKSGKVINFRNSWQAHTVPWEVAAQPPLKLSPKSQERYKHSLKRHWTGYLVRSQQDEREFAVEPRLDQLVFEIGEIMDLLLSMRETMSDNELKELEGKLGHLILGED